MNPSKSSAMKSVSVTKILVVISALFLPLVTCIAQNDPADQVVGTWIKKTDMSTITLTFKADKKVEVEFTGDDVVDVYASYDISGKKITFQDEGGEYSSGTAGFYEFELGENSVTFTIVDDPVEGRSMMLAGTWSKAQ
jgi:hypothetical protein